MILLGVQYLNVIMVADFKFGIRAGRWIVSKKTPPPPPPRARENRTRCEA